LYHALPRAPQFHEWLATSKMGAIKAPLGGPPVLHTHCAWLQSRPPQPRSWSPPESIRYFRKADHPAVYTAGGANRRGAAVSDADSYLLIRGPGRHAFLADSDFTAELLGFSA